MKNYEIEFPKISGISSEKKKKILKFEGELNRHFKKEGIQILKDNGFTIGISEFLIDEEEIYEVGLFFRNKSVSIRQAFEFLREIEVMKHNNNNNNDNDNDNRHITFNVKFDFEKEDI